MRCYKVVSNGRIRFAGTQADARQVKKDFIDIFGVKSNTVVVEEIEVPTAKKDLLCFINDIQSQVVVA